jgi:hypothetical protein
MNRETIMTALFNLLTAPPLVFGFTADTAIGNTTLANVSDTSKLIVGMPVMGNGLATDTTIASVSPAVTVSLPAISTVSASAMSQGFQTARRRLADPYAEQDMPALYLVEVNEVHEMRVSTEPVLVVLNCEALIFTAVGADQNAVPAATLNTLIDGIEAALYPTPRGYRQTLGLDGMVLYCRIEGEVQKDPGHDNRLAGAIVPIKIAAKLS